MPTVVSAAPCFMKYTRMSEGPDRQNSAKVYVVGDRLVTSRGSLTG